MSLHLKIGTRSSPLALKQTEIFINRLTSFYEFSYEIIPIKTTGDKVVTKPLYEIGGKALFLKELESALQDHQIDVAIHSLKDVPGRISSEFSLPFFLGREYPFDCLISKKFNSIENLPSNAKVGTCSPRRMALLNYLRQDIEIVPIRGNIGSRINMLSEEKIDAIILAESGLRRLDMYDASFCHRIDVDRFIPAVGQGVITAEVRSLDQDLIKILSSASDHSIQAVISIEREFINTLNADCDSPVGAYITQNSDKSYFGQFMYSPTISESLKFMEKFIDINKKNLGAALAMEILASN